MLVFHLQRRGRMMMHQRGQVEYASAGDVLIAEEDTPYDIDISDANDCLILNMPISLLGMPPPGATGVHAGWTARTRMYACWGVCWAACGTNATICTTSTGISTQC
jgi:hypothetical protein